MGIIFSILDLEEGQDTHEAIFLWSHLVPIYHVDFESGLKLINKRTSYQMNVTFCSIMRINLAAQVLSETEVTVLNNFAPETSGETGMFFIMMSKFLIT